MMSSTETMAQFAASDAACYEYPAETQGDLRMAFCKGAGWTAAEIERLTAENERLRETLCEIANRASNMMDRDAADWMPSIYKLACEAIGEDPTRLLKAAGWTGTVSIVQQQAVNSEEGK